MARRWYEEANATQLNLVVDPEVFTEAQDLATLAEIEEIQAASDFIRSNLASCNSFQNLGSYDVWLEDQRWTIQDRLDYYGYTTRIETITVKDGMWMTPDAVESVCGEEVGQEAILSIDGMNNTFWEHNTTEAHEIVYLLRTYRKLTSKIRIRIPTAAKAKLDNLTVHAALDLGQIDDPDNKVIDNISPVWTEGAWNELAFDAKKNARYVKLSGFGSANANDFIRLYEIDVWVETRDPA